MTAGHAAYEAYARKAASEADWVLADWNRLSSWESEAWEAAAQAAIAAQKASGIGALMADLIELKTKLDGLRALIAEILREIESGTVGQHTAAATARTLAETAEWRARAGLEG